MTVTDGHRRGRSVISALHVHSVFVTKYRRNALRSEHLDLLGEVFANVCSNSDAVLVECNGRPRPPPHRVPARRSHLPPGELPHRNHLWSPSYFTASGGGAPLAIMRQYADNQRRPG
jgi:putative transposase